MTWEPAPRPVSLSTSRLVGELTSAVPAGLLPAFRRFIAAHIFLHTLKLFWRYPETPLVPAVVAVVLLGAIAASTRGRLAQLGLAVLLVYRLYWVVSQFPMTGNHPYVESMLLLILLLYPDRPAAGSSGREADGTAVHLIQLLVLSIYFYSGLQKLVHGFWLNGEYLGQSLYSNSGFTLWGSVQRILQAISAATGAPLGELPFPQSAAIDRADVIVPAWTVLVFLGLSWAAVASEIVTPLLVFFPRTRRLGLVLLLITIPFIGVLSWETEFMFAALGGALLFFHDKPVRNYMLLIGVHVAWSFFVLFADLRVWVM